MRGGGKDRLLSMEWLDEFLPFYQNHDQLDERSRLAIFPLFLRFFSTFLNISGSHDLIRRNFGNRLV